MTDYIKREDAIKAIPHITADNSRTVEEIWGYNEALIDCRNDIAKIPAADVVEVVRCKDCIYYDDCGVDGSFGFCGTTAGKTEADGFCQNAERKGE